MPRNFVSFPNAVATLLMSPSLPLMLAIRLFGKGKIKGGGAPGRLVCISMAKLGRHGQFVTPPDTREKKVAMPAATFWCVRSLSGWRALLLPLSLSRRDLMPASQTRPRMPSIHPSIHPLTPLFVSSLPAFRVRIPEDDWEGGTQRRRACARPQKVYVSFLFGHARHLESFVFFFRGMGCLTAGHPVLALCHCHTATHHPSTHPSRPPLVLRGACSVMRFVVVTIVPHGTSDATADAWVARLWPGCGRRRVMVVDDGRRTLMVAQGGVEVLHLVSPRSPMLDVMTGARRG